MDRLDSQTSSRAVLQNLERLIHVDDTNVTGNLKQQTIKCSGSLAAV